MKSFFALAGLIGVLAASAQTDNIQVRAVADRDKVAVGQSFRVAVVLDLPAPWHCNANPPSQPDFIPTTLTFDSNPAVTLGAVRYPAGELVKVSWSDTPVALYSGQTVLLVDAKLTGAGPVTLTGAVRYQACDDQVCYAPKTVPGATLR